MNVLSDAWLSKLPLARWPILVCIEDLVCSRVYYLFHATERRSNTDRVTHLFRGQLLEYILVLSILV